MILVWVCYLLRACRHSHSTPVIISAFMAGNGIAFHKALLPFLGRGGVGRHGVAHQPLTRSLSLQDEVAHTVTESRVLQNTRHPFLTVSCPPFPRQCEASLWTELRERAQIFCYKAQPWGRPGGQGTVLLRPAKSSEPRRGGEQAQGVGG